MFFYIFLTFLCVIVPTLFFYLKRKTVMFTAEDHVMITGGSSGIGLSFAVEAVRKGASVTIIARNQERLDAVRTDLLALVLNPAQKVLALSVDVTSDLDTMKEVVSQAEENIGPVSLLVNCAGSSVCYRFEETPHEELERMLDLNVKGSFYITQAVVPTMKKRQKGNIIFVSSIAGLLGIYGYTAYSASKFAVVGMAQALLMELKPYGIGVTVALPPDTNTPGFAVEQKTKLIETRLISEGGGLFSPCDVAKKALQDAMNGHFSSSVGLDGWMLSNLCGGSFPFSSFCGLVKQVLTMGLFRLLFLKYIYDANQKIKAVQSRS